MIITKEKYKDTYIVYIDESQEDMNNMPAESIYDLLDLSCSHIQELANTVEYQDNIRKCTKTQPL